MKDLILAIFNIFTSIGKFITHLKNFFINALFLFVMAILVYSLIPKEEVAIPEKSILRLDISGNIVEESRAISSFEKFFATSLDPESPPPETVLQDILDTIATGAEDNHIAILLLNLKNMGHAGLNQLQTIGMALDEFRTSGKKIIAAEDNYSQTQYYLASHADEIIINPMGGVDLHGFGAYRLYFKKALEKLSINYNIFKIGSYKSAVEPLTRNNMSPEDRHQNEIWLSALWQVYTDDIIKHRKISKKAIDHYTNNISQAVQSTGGDLSLLAKQTGLVDNILTRNQTRTHLSALCGDEKTAANIISSVNYLKALQRSYQQHNGTSAKIGLIIAEGNILPGRQKPGLIGGDSLAALLKKSRLNSSIKAVVLRINSGGGSAFASEIIRQEILELKKKGKPVVVSMGSLAASGGYWIAADADEIWASPATLTGSIGIFGAIPTFENSLANIGIYSDGVGTTPLAAGLNISRPLPDQLKTAMQQTIEFNYDKFLNIVAGGRHMEKRRVHALAQGRVYDGKTAQSLGLIDRLGTLAEAVTSAAAKAHLKNYSTEYIRTAPSVSDKFLKLLESSERTFFTAGGVHNPWLQRVKRTFRTNMESLLLLDDPHKIYAHCLINLSI